MNDQTPRAIYLGIWLVLIVSAFAVRRVPLKASLKMALAWVGIFVIVMLIVSGRDIYVGWWTKANEMITGPDRTVAGSTLRIPIDKDGRFYVRATINGVERRMLIDSGTTGTVIGMATARAAKVDIEESPFPGIIDTANGPITARVSTIHRIDIGPIHVVDLPGYVAPNLDDVDILGMNFLSRLKSWRVEGQTMILEPQR